MTKYASSEKEAQPPEQPKKIHYTAITDTLFDAMSAQGISPAGKDVVYYILRHTEGWQQLSVRLSGNEFMHGRLKPDGKRYDHGTSIKSQHTLDAAIEEVGLAGFIAEIDHGGQRERKSYALQPRWLETDPARLAQFQPPRSDYQCVERDDEWYPIRPQKPPVYQGVKRGKPRQPRSAEHWQKLHKQRQETTPTYAKNAHHSTFLFTSIACFISAGKRASRPKMWIILWVLHGQPSPLLRC